MWFEIKCQMAKLYCWLTNGIPVIVVGEQVIRSMYFLPGEEHKHVKVARLTFRSLHKHGYYFDGLAVNFRTLHFGVDIEKDMILLTADGYCSITKSIRFGNPEKYIKWYHLNKSKRAEQILKYG